MTTITYKCDTCKGTVSLVENLTSLTTFGNCNITQGCNGTLHRIRQQNTTGSRQSSHAARRAFFEHRQSILANPWKINHRLGVSPAVIVYLTDESTGKQKEISPDEYTVTVVDENNVQISFESKRKGIAHLIARSSVPLEVITEPTEDELFQVSNSGILSFAVPIKLTNPTVELIEADIDIKVSVKFPSREASITTKTLNDSINLNSPWGGWDNILIRRRRNFATKTTDISTLSVFDEFDSLSDIPDGTTLTVTEINTGSGFRTIGARELFLLLANPPYNPSDKIQNEIVDIGELRIARNNNLIFRNGELFINTANIESVYPSIRKVVVPAVAVSPTPTPTITPTPSVTSSTTPTPTQTVTPTPTPSSTTGATPTPTTTVTPTHTTTPSVTPSVTPSAGVSVTPTPTNTVTPSVTSSPSNTPSVTPTRTPTNTPTPSPTRTPTPTPTPSSALQEKAFISGGGKQGPSFSTISITKVESFPFSSPFTSASLVGDLADIIFQATGHSSDTNGYAAGGQGPTGFSDNVTRFPFSSPFGTSTNVGTLSETKTDATGTSSPIGGWVAAGRRSPSVILRDVLFFPFASPFTNAGNTNDLLIGTYDASGHGNDTHGYVSGGKNGPSYPDDVGDRVLRYAHAIPAGLSSQVGSLLQPELFSAGLSGPSHGYRAGGFDTNSSIISTISRFPFSSPFATSVVVGDLTTPSTAPTGNSGTDTGAVSGGTILIGVSYETTSRVETFPFSSPFTSSSVVGDLTEERVNHSGQTLK